jgi:hypothetical protein
LVDNQKLGIVVHHRIGAKHLLQKEAGIRPSAVMRCYFLRAGRIAGVELMPEGLSDEEAVVRAHVLLAKRKGPFDSFEVWARSRFVFRQPLCAEIPDEDEPRPASPGSNYPAH